MNGQLALYLHLVGGGLVIAMAGIWIGMASADSIWKPRVEQLLAEIKRLVECNKALSENRERHAR